jgi:hypothetical protein
MMKNLLKILSLNALSLAVLSGPAIGQTESTAGTLESTRSTLAKWVETQQIISREREDWKLGKEVLEQRTEALRSEIASLEQRIDETRRSVNDADRKRREMIAESDALKATSASLVEALVSFEAGTKQLLLRLPDLVRDRVRPLSQRLPEHPERTALSLGERFQNVIGIINEVNKFNQNITVTRELRALPDGSKAEVEALYIGLGQAYYVTPDGEVAGSGRPTAEGWQWTRADELAPRVAQAISILQNEKVPAYVPVPVDIR